MSISTKNVFTGLVLICYLVSAAFLYPQTTSAIVNIRCGDQFQKYVRFVILPPEINLREPFKIRVAFSPIADTSFNYYLKATQVGTPTPLFGVSIGNTDFRTEWMRISDPADPEITFDFNYKDDNNNKTSPGAFQLSLMYTTRNLDREEEVCKLGTINFTDKDMNETACNLKMPDKVEQGKPFTMNIDKVDKPGIKYGLYFFHKRDIDINKLPKGMAIVQTGLNLAPISQFTPGKDARWNSGELPDGNSITVPYGNSGGAFLGLGESGRLTGGEYVAVVEARRDLNRNVGITGTILEIKYLVSYCSYHPFTVSSEPTSEETDGTIIAKPGRGGNLGGDDIKTETCLEKLRKDPNAKCAEAGGKRIPDCGDQNDPRGSAIATAIGCIHTNSSELVKDFMTFVIGISGGLAFLMMLLGAFQILSSADNPDTLKAGRERLTSAVIGLLIVIFAVLLLQIIGAGILDIPGFK